MSNSIKDRLREAKSVVLECVAKHGIYAGTHRYKYQCWTRDLAFGLDVLLNLGQAAAVKKHLLAIARKQKKSGKVPIMYITNFVGFLSIHARDLLTHKRRFSRQIRLFSRESNIFKFSFENLTPWTKDGETLFIIASMKYFQRTHDMDFLDRVFPHLEKALKYLEKYNLNKDGFLVGVDWRDINTNLAKSALLSNNVMLYQAYMFMGESNKAESLKDRINICFWNGLYYRDRLDSEDFDVFGQSWAVLYGIVPRDRYPSIINKFHEMDTIYGLRSNNNAPDRSIIDADVQAMADQFDTIWPFVTCSGILALSEMGVMDFAKEQFIKLTNLTNFCEWYNADNGSCLGDRRQFWSAALYIIACERLMRDEIFKSSTGFRVSDYIEVIPVLNFTSKI